MSNMEFIHLFLFHSYSVHPTFFKTKRFCSSVKILETISVNIFLSLNLLPGSFLLFVCLNSTLLQHLVLRLRDPTFLYVLSVFRHLDLPSSFRPWQQTLRLLHCNFSQRCSQQACATGTTVWQPQTFFFHYW